MPKNNKFEKMVKDQQHLKKIELLEQVCQSIELVFGASKEDPEEPQPWVEEIEAHKFQFKKIEFVKQFGVVNLYYVNEDNKEQSYRLSLELKRS